MASDVPRRHVVPVWLCALVLFWGAASFGAVYDWALWPLLIGAALLPVLTFAAIDRRDRWTIGIGTALVAAPSLQLVPLPGTLIHRFTHRLSFSARYEIGGPEAWERVTILPGATIKGVICAAAFVAFAVFLSASLRKTRRGPERLAFVTLLIATIVAIEGIVQKAAFNDRIYWFWESEGRAPGNYFGPFVNRNHFAGWMILGVSLAAGWLLARMSTAAKHVPREWRHRVLWLASPELSAIAVGAAALLTMVVSLVWTMSRSGIAGGTAALAILAVAALARFAGARQVLAPAAIAAVLALGIAWKGTDTLAAWYGTTDTLEWRVQLWRDSVPMVRDFWVAGSGLNTYGTLAEVYPRTDTRVLAGAAHNDYLQLLIEGGLLVAVPVFLAIAAFVRTAWSRLRAHQDERAWWIRLGAIAGICGVAVQEMSDFSLQIPGVAVLFATAVAIAIHEPAPSGRPR